MEQIQLVTEFSVYKSVDELNEEDKLLVMRARQANQRSYSPYSHFQVGAALLLDDGTIIEGNNQENAAYPSGLCAERVAIFYANAQFPDKKVVAIAISVFGNGKLLETPIPPCGGCRQVLLETEQRFSSPVRVIMSGSTSIVIAHKAADLLPLHFDGAMLQR